ncbi:hypothetical protein FGO68_gene12310 [Halteria grandinella]|uniref:COPI associated protein n=1 Tax=Halteria grandinella TaxID=5974 RepID=A0A8J8NFF2_HALGN|nr:hypothetical protein FGO68_gene12310 [Halteria grandinella]
MKYQLSKSHHSSSYQKGRKRLFIRVARLMVYFAFMVLCMNVLYRMLITCGLVQANSTESGGVTYLMMTLFQGAFAALLILAELRKRGLLIYIEFLRGRFGKGLLLLMIGVLVFDENRSNDMATGILIVLGGLFNVIVSCMRSDFDSVRDKQGRRQDSDYEGEPLNRPDQDVRAGQDIEHYGTLSDDSSSTFEVPAHIVQQSKGIVQSVAKDLASVPTRSLRR